VSRRKTSQRDLLDYEAVDHQIDHNEWDDKENEESNGQLDEGKTQIYDRRERALHCHSDTIHVHHQSASFSTTVILSSIGHRVD
jgi:hypothetical protein